MDDEQVLQSIEQLVEEERRKPFLQTIANRDHPEHASMLQWSGGPHEPDAFDPGAVVFDDLRKRLKKAFAR